MNQNLANNLAMVFLFFAAVVLVVSFPGKDNRLVHPMTNDLAMQPDHLMMMADEYLKDHKNEVSIKYMDRAIESMKMLERDADAESDLVLEAAIRDLKLLETELLSEKSDRERVNHAFVNAFNSLALAQLRESEVYLEEKNYCASKAALAYANKHLENAILFSNSQELKIENEFKNSINTIALDSSLPNDQAMAQLDGLISQMNTVVLH